MDNRKTITLIIILLLLLLCWHFCKRKARVLPIVPIASPPVPKAVRPAYLGQPVMDCFPVEIPIPEPPVLLYGEVNYQQFDTQHALLLYFDKPMQNPYETVPVSDVTIYVNGIGVNPVVIYYSSNLFSCESITSEIGDTVTVDILSGNIKSADGAIFAGITDFEIINNL